LCDDLIHFCLIEALNYSVPARYCFSMLLRFHLRRKKPEKMRASRCILITYGPFYRASNIVKLLIHDQHVIWATRTIVKISQKPSDRKGKWDSSER
jgi:hypothetical protein